MCLTFASYNKTVLSISFRECLHLVSSLAIIRYLDQASGKLSFMRFGGRYIFQAGAGPQHEESRWIQYIACVHFPTTCHIARTNRGTPPPTEKENSNDDRMSRDNAACHTFYFSSTDLLLRSKRPSSRGM